MASPLRFFSASFSVRSTADVLGGVGGRHCKGEHATGLAGQHHRPGCASACPRRRGTENLVLLRKGGGRQGRRGGGGGGEEGGWQCCGEAMVPGKYDA